MVPQDAGMRKGPGGGMKHWLLSKELAMPLGLAAASSEQRAAGQTPTRLVRGSGVMGHLEFITKHTASPGWVPVTATRPCFTAGVSPAQTTQAAYCLPWEVQGVPHAIPPQRMGDSRKGPDPEPWAPQAALPRPLRACRSAV